MTTRRAVLIGLAAAGAAGAARAAARAAGPVFTPERVRADFAAMKAGLESGAYDLWAFTPKTVMDAAWARAEAAIVRPMSLLEVRTHFQRWAALARLGHARVDPPFDAWGAYRAAGGRGFPLDVRIVKGRVFVAADRSGLDAVRPGDEITALAGEPMSRWLKRTGRNVSAETDYMLWSLLEYDLPLYLWLEQGPVSAWDMALRREGRTVRVRLPARTRAEMAEAAEAEPSGPPPGPAREARMIGEVAYLKPGAFFNIEARTEAEGWDVTGFRKFTDEAFAGFEAAGARRLLIDLRGNPGGDSSFSDLVTGRIADRPYRFVSDFRVKVSPQAMKSNAERIAADAVAAGAVSQQYAELYARSKPGERARFEVPLSQPAERRFPGKAFLLVDRQSYSNTVAVAATVQDYRFGTILGEETSDHATTYGAMERFALPETGISVGFPKARLVRPNGDLRPRGVVPDVAVASPIVATAEDRMLRDALAVVRK
jgi:hypothetical protein